MRKLGSALKRFFFPPEGSPLWVRALPFIVLGILTAIVVSGSTIAWEYTNSSPFCGTTCHTMPPEYSAYQRSPHARVQCVECHIGRDVITAQFSRKAGDITHILRMITKEYEFPIHTKNMRPARESCETCHFPEKFSDDSLREVRHYKNDETNTAQSIFLIMKTGGGSKREGLGRGIHWHIENEVWFLATDLYEQQIPYVRVADESGVVAEYYDVAANITPQDIAGTTLKRMDCITCHNRITHSIPSPQEAVDQAITKKIIPADLPFVREQAIQLLSTPYPDDATALEAMNALERFYAENYPEIYTTQLRQIRSTVEALKEMYSLMVFRQQKVDWSTHPDNLGHKEDPGCFRCHDGKHLTQTGEAIRLECNLCHSIPVLVEDQSLVTNIELVRGPEPASHTHTNWISLHGKAIDSSCAACHIPSDPSILYTEIEGKPPNDDSFCGNAACHGPDWKFTGFGSPALAPILEQQLYILQNTSPFLKPDTPRTYEGTFKEIFDGRCVFCHSGAEAKAELDLSTYQGILRGGTSGPGIVPGDITVGTILARQRDVEPHFGQMFDDELEALEAWIAAGAPEK